MATQRAPARRRSATLAFSALLPALAACQLAEPEPPVDPDQRVPRRETAQRTAPPQSTNQKSPKRWTPTAKLTPPSRDAGRTTPPARRQTTPRPATTAGLSDDVRVRRMLRTKKVGPLSFTEETGDYREVIQLLRTVTGIPIILTPQARKIIADESLALVLDVRAPLALENLLSVMANKSEDLGWTVRNGVVEFTTKAVARGKSKLVVHDVRVLVFPRTEFLPPKIAGIPTGEGVGSRSGDEGDEKVSAYEPDQLMQLVKLATDPDYWDTDGGGEMDYVESGYLLVKSDKSMQRRVARVLAGLR